MHSVAVYLGPSLPLGVARSALDAEYLPPIRRGDLARLPAQVECVGIVDGEFYQNLAVSPKEILPLLERGIRVYGASSMGALRAAELYPYGMTGVGRIFTWYRDGVLTADDEVALAYDPETYRPLSDPLVNIRVALQEAVCQQIITAPRAAAITEELRKTWFPGRSYKRVAQLCPPMRAFLENNPPDQKADDALLLLRTIAADRAAAPGGASVAPA
jgi:TfuA protein